MKLILKTPKFIKDLIKKIEYQEPVRYPKNFNPIPKPKIYRDGCPYCGSPKFVQLTTRKLCTNCHETYNRMKSVKLNYVVPSTKFMYPTPPEMTDSMKSMLKMMKSKK